MKDNNPWIVGGDDILKQFTVSRLARPDDKQANCARQWIQNGILVRIFEERSKAQALADKLNKQTEWINNLSEQNQTKTRRKHK